MLISIALTFFLCFKFCFLFFRIYKSTQYDKSCRFTFTGTGILILCIGLVVRLVVTYVCVWTNQFTHSERIFMSMAWLPKATVQAAIGSVALDVVKEQTNPLEKDLILGRQVLTLAVLAILVTAPIGAFLIAFFGPRLLEKEVVGGEDLEMVTSPMQEGKKV